MQRNNRPSFNYDDYMSRIFNKKNKWNIFIYAFTERINRKESIHLYFLRGWLYFLQDKIELAIADFDKAIEIDKFFIRAYLWRSEAHFSLGNIAKAFNDINRAIQIKPRTAHLYYQRAYFYKEQEEIEKAITDYTTAIKLNPNYVSAYNKRALLYKKREQLQLALADLQKAISINSKDVNTLIYLGDYFYDKNEFDTALMHYEEAKRNSIESYDRAMAITNCANIYYQKKKYDNAIMYYKEAIALHPILDAYNNLASTYYRQRNYDAALTNYTKVIELSPNQIMVYKSRALIYKLQNKPAEEFSEYVHVLKLDPNDKDGKENLKRLLRNKNKIDVFNEIKTLAPKEAFTVMEQALNLETELGRWFFQSTSLKIYISSHFWEVSMLQSSMNQYYGKLIKSNGELQVKRAARILSQAARQNEQMRNQKQRQYQQPNAFFYCPPEIIKKIASQCADDLSSEVAVQVVEQHFCKPT